MRSQKKLQDVAQRYLEERRRLGFSLQGSELMRFARYVDKQKHTGPLTLELQLQWARLHVQRTSVGTCAKRLHAIRPFTRYYQQFEPETEISDGRAFPREWRQTPHIYTQPEIVNLISAAGALVPVGTLRPATYRTLFGLIAVTGLRLSEALHLQNHDVDLYQKLLIVRETKNRKSRRLPLRSSVATQLRKYELIRDVTWHRAGASPYFPSHRGVQLPKRTVEYVFEGLRKKLKWESRGTLPNPRIQDLRHTFAVRCIQSWHKQAVQPDRGLFWLCTYLGHTKVSDTYWYVTGVPELMAAVGSTFERFVHAQEKSHER